MARSADLRKNKAQHAPKNRESKYADKRIYAAMQNCIIYLEARMKDHLDGYQLVFEKDLSFKELMEMIKSSKSRLEFDNTFLDRKIKPDGGVIWLLKDDDSSYKRLIVVSEVKKQGTNKERQAEGKAKQSQGNAIERLGKNLIGIRAALNHEPLTPFVCFGWGCDFDEPYDKSSFVMSKVSMMNEFYPLNRTYVFKKKCLK